MQQELFDFCSYINVPYSYITPISSYLFRQSEYYVTRFLSDVTGQINRKCHITSNCQIQCSTHFVKTFVCQVTLQVRPYIHRLKDFLNFAQMFATTCSNYKTILPNEGQGQSSRLISNENILCPLYNFKTVKDFFMKLCTHIRHDRTMCREKKNLTLLSALT